MKQPDKNQNFVFIDLSLHGQMEVPFYLTKTTTQTVNEGITAP